MTAKPNNTIDMWSGWFDWRDKGFRFQVSNGRPVKMCGKNVCGMQSPWAKEASDPWQKYPDLPSHLAPACAEYIPWTVAMKQSGAG